MTEPQDALPTPETLLPCPFCGGKDHLYLRVEETPSKEREVPFITCGECAAEGAKPLGSFERDGAARTAAGQLEAIAAWNRRSASPAHAQVAPQTTEERRK